MTARRAPALAVAAADPALELLHRVADALDTCRTLAPEERRAAAGAIRDFLAGHVDSLDQGFKVNRLQSKRDPRNVARMSERDQLLCEAAATFWPGGHAKTVADYIDGALLSYATTRWHQERKAESCPHPQDNPFHYWWRILRADPDPPRARRIRAILARGHEHRDYMATNVCDRSSEPEE